MQPDLKDGLSELQNPIPPKQKLDKAEVREIPTWRTIIADIKARPPYSQDAFVKDFEGRKVHWTSNFYYVDTPDELGIVRVFLNPQPISFGVYLNEYPELRTLASGVPLEFWGVIKSSSSGGFTLQIHHLDTQPNPPTSGRDNVPYAGGGIDFPRY